MRRPLGALLVLGTIALLAPSAEAQVTYGRTDQYRGPYSAFGAPGYFGTAYGVPSFGMPRTYSAFSSSYGPGYGYGYGSFTDTGCVPTAYGVGLWRPGVTVPGYTFGAASYRTFPVPYRPPLADRHDPAGRHVRPGIRAAGLLRLVGIRLAGDRDRHPRPLLLGDDQPIGPRPPQGGGLGDGGDPDLVEHGLARSHNAGDTVQFLR